MLVSPLSLNFLLISSISGHTIRFADARESVIYREMVPGRLTAVKQRSDAQPTVLPDLREQTAVAKVSGSVMNCSCSGKQYSSRMNFGAATRVSNSRNMASGERIVDLAFFCFATLS